MEYLNLVAGWIGILCGMVSGAVHGLWFHRVEWLGGYAAWPRRLTRLGHISFFGLAFINLAFAWSLPPGALASEVGCYAAWALVIGALTMPLCCYLAAFVPVCRHLFCVPVVSLVSGACVFIHVFLSLLTTEGVMP
jgi:hypothetical protein